MKVLLVDHAPIFGGAEAFLLDLISALDRQNFTPAIVTAPDSPVLSKFQTVSVPLFTTPFPQINRNPLFWWHLFWAGRKLAQVARHAQADLMHTFTARAHLIGAVAAQLSGVPLLWRIGDDTLPAWLISLFGRIPRRIVGVSQWITSCYPRLRFDGLVPDGARPASPISRAEARAELGLAPNDLVVAHVGRLVRWKGQDVFIKALAQARQSIPNIRGVIIGNWNPSDERPGPLGGGESYHNELRALASNLGLNTAEANRVIFAGFVRDPGLGYAAADVFVHTSTRPEPFGRVVIEAMMAGCPVVVARAGAQPEIVIEGKTGLLTPPGDATALAEALIYLLRSQEKRHHMGLAARQRAQSEYTLEIMTRRMEEAYRLTLA